jgi:hypothetical protein
MYCNVLGFVDPPGCRIAIWHEHIAWHIVRPPRYKICDSLTDQGIYWAKTDSAKRSVREVTNSYQTNY